MNELDNRIEIAVFGRTPEAGAVCYRIVNGEHIPLVPSYSTDMAAAWLIVEHLKTAGWYFSITAQGAAGDFLAVVANEGKVGDAEEPSAALAICHAALAALE